MKKTIKIAAFLLMGILHAQWADNGNNTTTMDAVGIGTTSPSSELEVKSVAGNNAEIHINAGSDDGKSIIRFQDNGQATWGFLSNYPSTGKFSLYNYHSNSNSIIVDSDGRVAIGTTSPSSKLDVRGGIRSSYDNSRGIALFNSGDGNSYLNYKGGSSSSRIGFQIDGSSRMSIMNDGSVGIGTINTGSYKLAVNGKIRAKEIKVETGWADFVFEEDYDLPTLKEVEQHIKEKGHLINIPSAKEVEENGIELGEMNKLLLQKIEELTLYTLQQQTVMEELKSRLEKLESTDEKDQANNQPNGEL